MNRRKPSQLDHVVSFFFYAAAPITVGIMVAFHFGVGRYIASDFATRGQFGDQFGALNALFTGVAFLGLVLTTAMQAKATRQQTDALELEKEALEHQAEELKSQRAELRRSAEAQEEANRLSRMALVMEARRMEMDIVLKRVDGAASEAEREAGLREAKEIAGRAAGEVEGRLGAVR